MNIVTIFDGDGDALCFGTVVSFEGEAYIVAPYREETDLYVLNRNNDRVDIDWSYRLSEYVAVYVFLQSPYGVDSIPFSHPKMGQEAYFIALAGDGDMIITTAVFQEVFDVYPKTGTAGVYVECEDDILDALDLESFVGVFAADDEEGSFLASALKVSNDGRLIAYIPWFDAYAYGDPSYVPDMTATPQPTNTPKPTATAKPTEKPTTAPTQNAGVSLSSPTPKPTPEETDAPAAKPTAKASGKDKNGNPVRTVFIILLSMIAIGGVTVLVILLIRKNSKPPKSGGTGTPGGGAFGEGIGYTMPVKMAQNSSQPRQEAGEFRAVKPVMLVGPDGNAYPLTHPIKIGRNPDNNIIYPPEYVSISLNHATLWIEGGKVYIIDTSTTGTYLERFHARIPSQSPVELVPGDVIYLGEMRNKFQIVQQ